MRRTCLDMVYELALKRDELVWFLSVLTSGQAS